MVDQKDVIKIDSDILVAPHHGADNGSSTAFIDAVSPTWVVFSAGSKFEHPRQVTVDRYKACGVPEVKMLRTDLGDKQRAGEWSRKHTADGDSAGDDDVDILIRADETFQVEYRDPHNNAIWQQP
jgi:competence protein ComEC